MKNLLWIKNFFTVLKCPSCGEPFELGREGKGVLCSECARKWEDSKKTICPECGNMATVCNCMPNLMKRSGVSALLKLGFYENGTTAMEKTVLYMKDFRDNRVFDFVASEFVLILDSYLTKNNIKGSELVFTFSPRSRKNFEKSGFDQAAELAKRCAKHYNAYFARLIKRKLISKNQKGLDQDGRLKNARYSLVPNEKICVDGMTVVVVDDVITTGSSLSVCSKCIKSLGAKKIICLSVTKTFGKINNKTRIRVI